MIEEVHKQMVVDRQPCRTLVPPDGAYENILGHFKVASYTGGLEGYHEKMEFEDVCIPTLLLHDCYEGSCGL